MLVAPLHGQKTRVASIARRMGTTRAWPCIIDGKDDFGAGKNAFQVFNPATGACVGTAPSMDRADAQRAITAAAAAQEGFAATSVAQRVKWLHAIAEEMMASQDELGELLSSEGGKPIAEARGEIAYGASFFTWFAEEARRAYGTVIPSPGSSRMFTVREPVGPCALICPWNFPNAMIARKLAPAIAAGCTSVIKPAEDTPLSALRLADIVRQVGVPAGAVNVVTCPRDTVGEVGDALATSPLIRKLSFTGSTAVGKHLAALAAGTVKRLSLELGGNAPFIVFPDANLNDAVRGAMVSKFRNAGQTCVCSNRFYVHESVRAEFVEKLAAAVRALRVGDPADVDVTIGPLINDRAVDKVHHLVSNAIKRGAVRVATAPLSSAAQNGSFVAPTVIDSVTPDMDLAREEAFGPVAPILSFTSEDEVVRMANDTRAGLAAYVYTRDVARSWRMAERLQFGMVGVNEGLISTAAAPFGGVKESGYGREGGYCGLEEYTSTKYICMGGM